MFTRISNLKQQKSYNGETKFTIQFNSLLQQIIDGMCFLSANQWISYTQTHMVKTKLTELQECKLTTVFIHVQCHKTACHQ